MTKSFRLDGVDKDRILEFWNLAVPRAQLESFLATENGVLLGRRVFDTYGDKWSVGTAIQLGVLNDVAAVVCGVYDAGGSALDSRALAGREFVQKALGKQGICNSILVKVDGLNRVEEVIERIDRGLVLPKKTETVSESAVNARLLRELGDTRTAAALIACVALGAVFLGIWNALSMTVYDRVREFGVLRSIGFTRRRIAALVLMEGAGIALAGGALAVPLLLGAVALFGRVVGEIQLRDAVVPVSVDAALLGLSLPIAAAVGLLGSVIPAVAASTKSVVAALRSAG